MKKFLIFTLILALQSSLFAATKEEKDSNKSISMSDVKDGIKTAKDVKDSAKDAVNTVKEFGSLFK